MITRRKLILKKCLLWTTLGGAVAFAGCLVLGWIFNVWFVARYLALPLMLGLASLETLTCLYVRDKGKLRVIMLATIVLAWSGAALTLLGITLEELQPLPGFRTWSGDDTRWILMSASLATLASLAGVQWGLLALLRLDQPRNRVIRNIAQGLAMLYVAIAGVEMFIQDATAFYCAFVAFALAQVGVMIGYLYFRKRGWRVNRVIEYGFIVYLFLFVGLIWQWDLIQTYGELVIFGSPYDRATQVAIQSVSGVVTLLATGLVPILALLEHFRRQEDTGSLQATTVLIGMSCPRCGMNQMIRTGANACSACGLKFKLEVEEPRCECGYLLYQLHGGQCPECGRAIPVSVQPGKRTPESNSFAASEASS